MSRALPDPTPFTISDPLPGVGTTVLEASAGTGKTWTIAALVTRYVAEGVLTLPQLLVVTFGRAASQELRDRVRARLLTSARALATAASDATNAGGTGTVGSTDRADSTGDPLLGVLLDTGEATGAARQAELTDRLRRLRQALVDIDATTIATTHQFCQQVLRGLGVAGTTDADTELVEDLDELLRQVVDDLYLAWFAQAEQPAFSHAEAVQIAVHAAEDPHAGLRPTDAPPGSPAQRRVAFAQAVRTEFTTRKRRLRLMQYDDLLGQVADALIEPGSPARARMRARWKVVLVDEFQDTDPVQWQVLDRAFTGHAAMVLIGDPKQAIYLFRGGDVVTYLKAAGAADHQRTLSRNFRSDEPLVRALNVLLNGAQLGEEQIVVRPVDAHRRGTWLRGAPHSAPLRLRHVGRDQVRSTRVNPIREHIARDVARDVAALLASGARYGEPSEPGRPLQANDVAVIAHTHARLLQIQAALRDVGVHAVTSGGSSVLQSQAARDWLAVLEAMAAPHDAGLARSAALTALLGYRAEDLARGDTGVLGGGSGGDLDGADIDDELSWRIHELAEHYTRHGIAAVHEILTVAGLPARTLATVGGERVLTDLTHVAELLDAACRNGRVGVAGLITWLRAQIAAPLTPGVSTRTRRLDSDATAVQLLTVHGSKGLQFPVVYLPTLWDRYDGGSGPPVPRFHEDPPTAERCLDVGGSQGPHWAQSQARHAREESGESLRLLYVALTRAQSQVVLWWAGTERTTPASPLHRVLFGRQPGQGDIPRQVPIPTDVEIANILSQWEAAGALRVEPAALAAWVAPSRAPEPPALAVRTLTRSIDHAWRRTSYSALAHPSPQTGPGVRSEPEDRPHEDQSPQVPPPVAAVGDPALDPAHVASLPAGIDVPSPMAGLPQGAAFGSLVHAVLEHTDPQAGDLRAELLRQVTEQLTRWPLSSDPRDAHPGRGTPLRPETLADALLAVYDSPLGPLAPGMRLRDIPLSDRLRELDFELPLGGGQEVSGRRVAVLGDLAPLLRAHLPTGDPVRDWADALDAQPAIAAQPLRGYLTGSIDVLLRTAGTYLVVDYKTDWVGAHDAPLTAASYHPHAVQQAVRGSSYPLQAVLYAVAAHRFLRWRLPGADPSVRVGGVLYLFLRGMCGPDTPIVAGQPCGVFSWRPPHALIEAVSELLDGGSR